MIFLGIDCGTQSTKTIALDWESGEILASAHKAYGFVPNLPPGAMEQEPKDWIDATEQSIGEVLSKLDARKDEVRGIGVSGQQHGLVVLDKEDRVVRPAKLWNDTTTSAQCDEITNHFGDPEEVIALVGNTMRTGYTAPKILWLRQNEPQNWKRTRSVLLPHDYLNFWLTGVKSMEFGDASGTALLDVKTRQWSTKVVDYIAEDLAGKLPPLMSSKLSQGTLREELCKKWGLAKAPSVSAGGGDNMMAAIGTGNIQSGVVTASLGTSGTLFAFSAVPIIDPQGEVAAFCDSTDNWLPLICTLNLTLVTEHIRKSFGWDYAQLEDQIRGVPAGCDGLLLLPYLTGERTPDLPNGTGVFHGLTLANFTAPHMARAAFEGVTFGLGYGLARFRELGMHPAEIRLTGGGSNSRLWRQMCADVFGVPTVCLQSGEGAGLGGAIQAGWVWNKENGSDATLAEICDQLVRVDESSRSEPDAHANKVYSDALNRTSEIRKALKEANLL
ncbi:MAG: xylulokinase [Terrimicrobiaceae bacterium]